MSSSSPCAACKLLRRKCTQGCVFAPYFPPDQPARFANVHKVFGASNVSKLLNDLPQVQREDAVQSLAYEADARLRDPVYGCVAYISLLQFKIKQVSEEINEARKELAAYGGHSANYSQVVPPMYAVGQSQQQIPMQIHPYREVHEQQQKLVTAQHMAAAVEVARQQNMMRQPYALSEGDRAPTVAIVPPGSAEPMTYNGVSYLIQQPPPMAPIYGMDQSPPPQSPGQSDDEISHTQQRIDN